MSEPNTPDSQEFARTVLHNLAGLTAEVYELRLLLAETLSKVSGTPSDELVEHYRPLIMEHTDRLYHEYLAKAKIPPGPDDLPPGPRPSPGANRIR